MIFFLPTNSLLGLSHPHHVTASPSETKDHCICYSCSLCGMTQTRLQAPWVAFSTAAKHNNRIGLQRSTSRRVSRRVQRCPIWLLEGRGQMAYLVNWKRQDKSQTEEGQDRTKGERKKLVTKLALEKRCSVSHSCWKYTFPVFVQKETSVTVVWKTGKMHSKGGIPEAVCRKRGREILTEILIGLIF